MKRTLLPVLLVVPLLLSGCGLSGSVYSNYRALEDLRLVQTLGYDGAPGSVTLSVSTGKQGESGEMLLLRRAAPGILKAMDSLQDYSTEGQLFFYHARYLLLGREAAESGIGPLLDFAERDLRLRLDTKLFVLKSGAAEDLIMNPGDDSYDATEALASVARDVELRGAGRVGNIRETAVALSEHGAALACLLEAAPTEGSVRLDGEGLTAVPAGYAVLGPGGRMLGTLEGAVAEAATLLLGGSGTVSRSLPDGQGGFVTVQFDGAGKKIEAAWTPEGALDHITITLSVRAAVAELSGQPEKKPDPDALCAALARSLEDDLGRVLTLCQSLGADFLDLSAPLRRSGGSDFLALAQNWLRSCRFEVHVDATLDRYYDLSVPVGLEGGAG